MWPINDMKNSIHGIYALCDNSQNPALSHLEIAKRLLAGGVRVLQLRMKGEADPNRVLATARSILKLKEHFSFTFIMNDFVQVALELPVDGVHLGQDDMDLEMARELLGPRCLLGYSSHSMEEALAAEGRGANYVAFGAIFPTVNKGPGHPIQGLEKLSELVKKINVPTVAIGGIGRSNFAEVLATGVSAIAMIGALTAKPDITGEARYFVEQFESARKSP